MTPLRSESAFDFNMKVVALCPSFPTQLAVSQSDIPSSSYGLRNEKVLWLLDFLVNLLEHSLGKVLSTEVARCYASLFRPY
ncbi:hypothetical protein QL285_075764 [Trifolium repens]|nr:hypothetical protein QL285_075764 [Trifolium repens]